MFLISSDRVGLPKTLANTLFLDRTRQFVGRHGWDLCVTPDGLEVDTYDDEASTYIVASDRERHLGSVRVRPVSAGTMLMDHFAEIFPEAERFLALQPKNLYELTRFCRDPGLSVLESARVLDCLAVGLDQFRDAQGATGFVAVVFAPVARFLGRIGVRYIRLGVSEIDGRSSHLICITHAVAPHRLLPLYPSLYDWEDEAMGAAA
jgi:N-acyl-L-homoserine lactone synthetase